jgi:chemotaxis protein methyltransferase CheR
MDVIFCRNVLIYFDRDTVAHVAENLIETLAEDGWIVLGATDPPLNEYVRCEVVQTKNGLAYRRPGRAGTVRGSQRRPGDTVGSPTEAVVRSSAPATPSIPARPIPTAPIAKASTRSSSSTEPTSGIPPALTNVVSDPAAQAAARVRDFANAGRLEDAGRECAAALDVFRESAELHYLHAVLVAQAHQFAESARAARRALYLDRSMIVAHAALGTALAKSGDAPGARRAFVNALRLLSAMDPNAIVPYSGGEPAGRMLEMTRMQSRLARGDAA